MKPKKMSPIKVTESQREWLENEQERTGNSMASIIRGLIQLQVTEAAKNDQQRAGHENSQAN